MRAGWEAENRACGLRLVAAHQVLAACIDLPECADDAAEPRPGYSVVDPGVMAASYLVRELAISAPRAEYMMSFAADLHFRYPAVLQAMLDGLMEERVARGLARQMAGVDDRVLPGIQAEVVKDYLDTLATGVRLGDHARGARVDEIISRHDPDGVRTRKADAARSRGIWIRKGQDGMSSMNATLRADEAAVLAEALEEKLAHDRAADEQAHTAATAAAQAAGKPAPVFEDDPDYTQAQRRADALMSLTCGNLTTTGTSSSGNNTGGANGDGSVSGTGGANGNGSGGGGGGLVLRPRITVITNPGGGNTPHPYDPTTTNYGSGTGPGFGAGTGSGFDPGLVSSAGVEFARTGEGALQSLLDLLAVSDGASIEQVDPTIGAADSDDGALRYRPSVELARRIRLRDGTCRHPGCTVSAQNCDLDHVVPFDHNDPAAGGPTVEWNMGAMCRCHHRFKTFSGWAYAMDPDGTLTITTPEGTVMITRPSGPLATYRREQHLAETRAWERQQRRHTNPDTTTTGTTGAGAGASAGWGAGGVEGQVYAAESGWARRARRQRAQRQKDRASARTERERAEQELVDIYGDRSRVEVNVEYCLHLHRAEIDRRRRASILILHPPTPPNTNTAGTARTADQAGTARTARTASQVGEASQAGQAGQAGGNTRSSSRWWNDNKTIHETRELRKAIRHFREQLDDPPPF